MFKLPVFVVVSLFISTMTLADNGLITLSSAHGVKETADRLEQVLKDKGMTIFARVDHAMGAKKVGLELLPTELVIFGNPKIGTRLMHCAPSVALDLPQKALIRQGENGKTQLSYNDPAFLKTRHDINGCDKILQKVSGALAKLAEFATKP